MVTSESKNVQVIKQIDENKKEWKVLGSRFELPNQYDVIDPIGSGAYGVVVAAKDSSI